MSFEKTCERRIMVAVFDGSGKPASLYMCGQPADRWARHTLMDCDDDPGTTYYEALCVNHALEAVCDRLMSMEEMELTEVHDS